TLPSNAYWIEADITVGTDATAGLLLAAKEVVSPGQDGNSIAGTKIGYDAVHHQLFVDRSHAGGGKIKAGREVQTIDLGTTGTDGSTAPAGKTLHLEILVDRSSLEVFADHGLYALSTHIFPDEDASSIYLFSDGGDAVIKSMKIWDLSPLHQH
ncbi:MAG TPA: GH32 C-terminal domain-containing protein, partial [Puia sp.]